jgi:hypothetical protein
LNKHQQRGLGVIPLDRVAVRCDAKWDSEDRGHLWIHPTLLAAQILAHIVFLTGNKYAHMQKIHIALP